MMNIAYPLMTLLWATACDDGKIVLTDPETEPQTDSSQGHPETNDAIPSELEPQDTGESDSASPSNGGTGDMDTAPPTTDDLDGDGFTTMAGDCDDSDPDIHPDARERCDDTDHDCDGLAYNDLMIRYDIDIRAPWNQTGFPSSHSSREPHRYSELWYNYRNYTTDQHAIGSDAPEYTGSIHPLVFRIQELDGVESNARWTFSHNDDGTLAQEARDHDDDGLSDYLATFTHNDDGLLLSKEYDGDGDGVIERTESFEYTTDGRLARFMVHEASSIEPVETITYKYDDEERTVFIETSDAEPPNPDSTQWIQYNEDGSVAAEHIDSDGDGSIDSTSVYTHDDEGRLTEIMVDGIEPSRTSFTYDAEGHLTHKEVDRARDSIIDEWEHHVYNSDNLLIRSDYGTQEIPGIDIFHYRNEYERDATGRWTSRTTLSWVDWMARGREESTYTVDGNWKTWTWVEHGEDEPSGTLSTTCMGPINPLVIEEF